MSAIVYKIWSHRGDRVYVGTTGKKYLSSRKADHVSKYRLKKGMRCSSYDLFDAYGVENCEFEEIDRARTERERYEKERKWINKLKAINTIKNPRKKVIYSIEEITLLSKRLESVTKRIHALLLCLPQTVIHLAKPLLRLSIPLLLLLRLGQ